MIAGRKDDAESAGINISTALYATLCSVKMTMIDVDGDTLLPACNVYNVDRKIVQCVSVVNTCMLKNSFWGLYCLICTPCAVFNTLY